MSPITQSDLDELWQAARLFTFPAFCKQETLFKIHAYLSLELAQPGPIRDEPEGTDQGEDPGPVVEVLQTWTPTATGVTYSATQPHREPLSPDWRRDFAPLDMTTYESDQ